MIYCLDTNICIYYLKGKYPALRTKLLSFSPSAIKAPAIVRAELLHGAEKSTRRDENISRVLAFLLPFDTVPFDDQAAVYYSKIRATLEQAGTIIGPNDLLIAATVMACGATLVTNNIKEFTRVENLTIEDWTN